MYCESFKSSTVDLWPAVSWHSRHLWLATPLSPLTPDLCTLCQIVTSEPEWWVRDEENEPQVSSAIWLVDWSPAEHTSLCTVFWCSRLLPWILSHDFVQCLSIFFLFCALFWLLFVERETKFYCLERSVHSMSFVSTDNSCGRFFCSIIVFFRTSWGWRTRQPLIYILLSPLSLPPSLPPSPSLSLSVSSGQRDQALDWKTAPPVFILSFLVLGSQKDAHCKQVILYIHVYVCTHSCQPFRNPSYCEYVCVWQFWKGTNPPLPGYAVKVWLQYKVSAADEIST